jgi:hypothetical protein
VGDNYPPWVVWSGGSPRIKKCPASERLGWSRCRAKEIEAVSATLQCSDAAGELSDQNSSHGSASLIFVRFTAITARWAEPFARAIMCN